MNKSLKAFLSSKLFLIAAGLLSFYFLFAYFAIDPLARRLLPWVAERQLASRMTVEHVKFDPLSLELTADGLRLSRPDGSPLAGWDRLYVNLQADSLFRFAWHLSDIRLHKPYVQFEILKDGKFNWADLLAKLNQDAQPSTTMARVVIDHLQIEQGRVHYAEKNRIDPYATELTPLSLELGQFSTLPEDRGDYLLAAELTGHGGILRWKGDVGVNPLASAGTIDIQGLKLDSLFRLLKPSALPLSAASGELGLKFDYDFAMVRATVRGKAEPYPQLRMKQVAVTAKDLTAALNTRAKLQLRHVSTTVPSIDLQMHRDGQVQLKPFDLHASGLQLQQEGKPLLGLEKISVSGIDYDLASNQLSIASLILKQGNIRAARSREGNINWNQIMPAPVASGAAKTSDANNNNNTKDAKNKSQPSPPFRFDIADIRLDDWKASYADETFARPLQASADRITLRLHAKDAGDGVSVSGLNASIDSVNLLSAGQAQPIARLERASLSDASLSLSKHTAGASALTFSGLQTQVIVNADKTINWTRWLESASAGSATKPMPGSANPAGNRTAPAWKVALQKVRLEKAALHLEDKGTRQPVALDVQDGFVELGNASLDLEKSLALKAKLPFKQGGLIEASGNLSPLPAKGELQLNLAELPLKPYAPYLSKVVALNLSNGRAAARGKLSFKTAKEFSAKFSGGFSITQLAIDEEDDGTPFLRWDELSSDSLRASLSPNRVHMAELRLLNPVGRIIIDEQKMLNVQHLMREPSATATPANSPASSASATQPTADKAFPVSVERIRITGGDLEFADLSLRPQFGAQVHELQGVINGLSSDAASTALVELDGKVDDFGSARVRGSVQPFRATDFTDLNVAFRNLEMTKLTPYSGKFAGRKIDSGKLSVDLEYKIKNRKLVGENKFVINTLKLGERVDSRDALHLPLDLAIALLEDSNGVIDINLPISGSLDDPQFSYGKIVWKAIVNVIEKIATAPFRALGKLLGISSEQLGAIEFDPGSAMLAPPQQEKLKSIAEALNKRATLTLHFAPTYDAQADKAALQELTTRRDVMTELGLPLREGEQPGPLDVSNVKVQTAIDNLLKDRSGEKRSLKMVDTVKDYFRKPKPEDVANYAAMLEKLKASVKISDASLSELAKARAAAIQTYLKEAQHLDSSRVTIAAPVNMQGNGKSVSIKMELGAAKDAARAP